MPIKLYHNDTTGPEPAIRSALTLHRATGEHITLEPAPLSRAKKAAMAKAQASRRIDTTDPEIITRREYQATRRELQRLGCRKYTGEGWFFYDVKLGGTVFEAAARLKEIRRD